MTLQSFAAEGFSFPWGLPVIHQKPPPMPKDPITRADWSLARSLPKDAARERMYAKVGRVEPPAPYIISRQPGKDIYSSAELDAWWAKSTEGIRLRKIECGKKGYKDKAKKG